MKLTLLRPQKSDQNMISLTRELDITWTLPKVLIVKCLSQKPIQLLHLAYGRGETAGGTVGSVFVSDTNYYGTRRYRKTYIKLVQGLVL